VAHKDRYIFGLDLGTTKTCALACCRGEEGKLEVAGLGVAESRGWRKGMIVNLDSAVLAIKKAVEAAEAEAKVSFEWAYVGVGGAHVKGVNSRGALTLGNHSREVTVEDKVKAFQTAKSVSLPPDRELIDALRQEYLLDSQNGIRDPLGMTGKCLEVNVHLITASTTSWQNVVTAANRAGIKVPDSGTIYEALASAWACLSEDERELGVALLDIGGGSSELIIFHHGTVRYTAVIAVSGEHFTNDIAVGLRTPIPEAEKMKRIWGDRDPAQSVDTPLEVPSVGERPTRVVNYTTLSEIIEPRTLELLELLHAELARSGFEKQLGAGVVLTGGGAKLGGLTALAEQVLGLPVRLGQPAGLAKMGDILPDPAFATVVGLVTYGNRLRLLRDAGDKSWAGRLWGALRGKGA
jgi:cell division protein FtsA